MSTLKVLQKLTLTERSKDYGYLIGFFLVFSFFIVAVIRPNITMVLKLSKELDDLKLVNASYNMVIEQIINIQSDLESTRSKIYVVDEALPKAPQIYKIISDLKTTATDNKLPIGKLAISDINLKSDESKNKFDSIEIKFTTTSDFGNVKNFMLTILSQRRLKTIESLKLTMPNTVSSDSATLNAEFTINGHYL